MPDAWAKAFTVGLCAKAWLQAGIAPFTRLPMLTMYSQEWREKEAELKRENKSCVKADFRDRDAKYFFPPEPETRELPEEGEVTVKTKIRSGDLALTGPVTSDKLLSMVKAKTEKKKPSWAVKKKRRTIIKHLLECKT